MSPSHFVTVSFSQIQMVSATCSGDSKRINFDSILHNTDLVNQSKIVADENNSSVEAVDGVGESVDGLHVEMVGGFVEEEEMRNLVSDLSKHNATLLTVRELLDRSSLSLACDSIPT